MNYPAVYIPPPLISSVSYETTLLQMRLDGNYTLFTNQSWPASNRAFYFPLVLPGPITVQGFWLWNGSSVGGHFDIGIYSSDGTKIISTGTTVQSGTTNVQFVSITPATIGPGSFWLAISADSGLGTVRASPSAGGGGVVDMSLAGILTQSSAFVLPATATFATPSGYFVPIFGLATVTTV